jgi:DNA-binding beta-propeller fold protein YncE
MLGAGVLVLASVAMAGPSFLNFESGPVRPLALSPDRDQLFAVNTPADRLAIFAATPRGLRLTAEVPVGLEPVAVAVRRTSAGRLQAWVVNHLSDSVSIVDVDPVSAERSHVVATLLVGDEPRDIVFGGRAGDRAFITTARRGQNLPPAVPAAASTPGIGRALVWVFDAEHPVTTLGGAPLAVLELFGDTPRALAVSPDGSRVYAAVFHSGNQTSIIPVATVEDHGGLPQPPPDSPYYPDAFPQTGLIVKFDGGTDQWRDELGRDWGQFVRVALPDSDVFAIDADADPPAAIAAGATSGVGTVLFNMAVRPGDGSVFVTNTEARNQVRFTPLIDADHGVSGHVTETRISVLDGAGSRAVELNPHIDYGVATGSPDEARQSLALPVDLTFSSDGRTLFVAAFGSDAVGVFDADALAAGHVQRRLVSVGGGPSGLALDERRDRLYVLNRLEQTVSIVTRLRGHRAPVERAIVPLGFDPTPAPVRQGRRFLYDASRSGHGDAACASCHVFGDMDDLAWDLGDPYGAIVANPNPAAGSEPLPPWHPMKGPMITQSLRGMAGMGPMHWRGDRTGGTQPGGDPRDSRQAFATFNQAFPALLGASAQLSDDEMRHFTDFALSIVYPPNPFAQLDGQPTAAEANGKRAFSSSTMACSLCHGGPEGTAKLSVSLLGSEGIKIPHLRNLYQKVGLFGQAPTGFEETGVGFAATPFLGPQVRGFGYFKEGMIGSIFGVASTSAVVGITSEATRRDVESFLLAFGTGLAPAVGQQLTATPATVGDPTTIARRELLAARAQAGDCDLVVAFVAAGEQRGGLYQADGTIRTDRSGEPASRLADFWARASVAGAEQTYTCVPPGAGVRSAIDRDGDGAADRDELDAGSDPADPSSVPRGPALVRVPLRRLALRDRGDGSSSLAATVVSGRISPPHLDAAAAPTRTGATLRVYNAAGSGEDVTVALPAAGWVVRHGTFRFRGAVPGVDVRIAPGRLVIRGTLAGYTLDEQRQRAVAVRVALGAGPDWCGSATTHATGRLADRPGRFRATAARTPAVCPPPPPIGP